MEIIGKIPLALPSNLRKQGMNNVFSYFCFITSIKIVMMWIPLTTLWRWHHVFLQEKSAGTEPHRPWLDFNNSLHWVSMQHIDFGHRNHERWDHCSRNSSIMLEIGHSHILYLMFPLTDVSLVITSLC